MNNQNVQPIIIPGWIIWAQCICFSVLYAIWALPDTILIRHICLVSGALLSLWVISKYWFLLFQARAIPVWLIIGLFIWAILHLFFLSRNFDAQYEEFTSIWKRTAIGVIFALGFGFALGNNSLNKKQKNYFLAIFYLGLWAPALIYVAKYILTHNYLVQGWQVPPFWRLYRSSSHFYLPKTVYVCFCLPVLAVAIGLLRRNLEQHKFTSTGNLIYFSTILTIFFVFYNENIKNGVIYGTFLILIFLYLYIRNYQTKWTIKILMTILIVVATSAFLINHFQTNKTWFSFISDAKFATQLDKYNNWQFNGVQGFPEDEFGKVTSGTNYERIAWAKAGLILLVENPMGYGLIERSFGNLARIKWPDSRLNQSHSGWLDLMLGIGIPGVLLILGSILFVLRKLYALSKSKVLKKEKEDSFFLQWLFMLWWILLTSFLMWSTTEISQKVYFDSLIFWVVLSSAFCLGLANRLMIQFPRSAV